MQILSETAPGFIPVADYEVKAALRIDNTADDALLAALTDAAIKHVEERIGSRLAQRTVVFSADCLSDRMCFPLSAVSAVSSITFLDIGRNQLTLDTSIYSFVKNRLAPVVLRKTGAVFPLHLQEQGSVLVSATVGYASAADIPTPLKQAVIVMVADLYKNPDRAMEATRTVDALIAPYMRAGAA